MKKAIASVLAASMALSLAACGGSSTATSSSTATESTASSTTAESTASGDKVTLRMTYWNSEDTVKAGSYKIQRPFVFVTNKSAALSEQAQAFVDFATSKDAADLIRTAGAVPVNE